MNYSKHIFVHKGNKGVYRTHSGCVQARCLPRKSVHTQTLVCLMFKTLSIRLSMVHVVTLSKCLTSWIRMSLRNTRCLIWIQLFACVTIVVFSNTLFDVRICSSMIFDVKKVNLTILADNVFYLKSWEASLNSKLHTVKANLNKMV